ncbi:MAG TPA: molybdenum cofactor guanylyltransferase MobA [Alphaproteobacteria bacterium]|jgi:molybdopterin-guanine dinucleotide biosynthesis protein A|nr:molybdenum cofactor guanylyltransferase MobA [Alphaproteobacteria bacterium]
MLPDAPAAPPVVGLILAGGLSRRMGGGDKSLRMLAGETLLARVISRVKPQVRAMVLNANGNPSRFSAFDLPVVADAVPGFAGPLAGVLTGLEWAREHAPGIEWVASFATDAPFFPRDLVARLLEAVESDKADLACAASNGRRHPVFGLWPVSLGPQLRRALVAEGIRKVEDWTGRYRVAVVEYPQRPFDPFFNANAPEDLAEAERILAAEAARG